MGWSLEIPMCQGDEENDDEVEAVTYGLKLLRLKISWQVAWGNGPWWSPLMNPYRENGLLHDEIGTTRGPNPR